MTAPYLWDPWKTAQSNPDRIAVMLGASNITFGQLVALSDELRRGLIAVGLPDGAVIGTSLPAGPELFALALAALRGGHGLFPVSKSSDPQRYAGLLRQAHARLDVVENPANATSEIRALTVGDLRSAGAVANVRAGPRSAGQPKTGYLVFTTSGTTGGPKVVVRRRPWYPYRGVAVMESRNAGLDRGPHVMASPAYHFGTLGPALYALQAGSGVAVMPSWSARQFCSVVEETHAESAFVTPFQLTDLVTAGVAPEHTMSCLFHGGAGTPPSIKRKAIELFGPILHEYYGTSEGMITEITTAEWLEHPGAAGRPLPGVRVQVVRDGSELSTGEVGAITVRYRAIDASTGINFAETGDVGYLDADGFLHVLGRGSAEDADRTALLEYQLRTLPGVSDVAVVAAAEGGYCIVEYLPDPDPSLADSVRQICKRADAGLFAVELGPTGSFARTASGKLSRTALGQSAENRKAGS